MEREIQAKRKTDFEMHIFSGLVKVFWLPFSPLSDHSFRALGIISISNS
jgi:hypothetical protein